MKLNHKPYKCQLSKKMFKITNNNKKKANDVNVISKERENARGKTPLEHCST
jgi:hypothetical protein